MFQRRYIFQGPSFWGAPAVRFLWYNRACRVDPFILSWISIPPKKVGKVQPGKPGKLFFICFSSFGNDIYLHLAIKFMVHVGKYTSSMDP